MQAACVKGRGMGTTGMASPQNKRICAAVPGEVLHTKQTDTLKGVTQPKQVFVRERKRERR